MEEMRFYTQDEVANILHTTVASITMLRELGILGSVKVGKNFLIAPECITTFRKEYEGLDVSNKVKALEAKKVVANRKAAI